MNITLQPRRFARRTDHISRGTITKDVPGPRYMEKGITPPTHPLRSLATLPPYDGCGPHGGRGSTSGPFQALRLTLRPFPGPSSRPLTAPPGLFRGVSLADDKASARPCQATLVRVPLAHCFAGLQDRPRNNAPYFQRSPCGPLSTLLAGLVRHINQAPAPPTRPNDGST